MKTECQTKVCPDGDDAVCILAFGRCFCNATSTCVPPDVRKHTGTIEEKALAMSSAILAGLAMAILIALLMLMICGPVDSPRGRVKVVRRRPKSKKMTPVVGDETGDNEESQASLIALYESD